eukprot:scaffold5152_cov60-Attheya_sp.AAC.9
MQWPLHNPTGIFANANISINPKILVADLSAPSSGTLKNLVADRATADSMVVCLGSIRDEGSRVFLTCDKGGQSNFVKKISWYSKKERRDTTFNLDNDKVGGTSRDTTFNLDNDKVGGTSRDCA